MGVTIRREKVLVLQGNRRHERNVEGKRKGRPDRNTALVSKIRRYIFLKNTFKEIKEGRESYKHILLFS